MIWAPEGIAGAVRERAGEYTRATGIVTEVVALDPATILATVIAEEGRGPDIFFGPHTWLMTLTDRGLAEPALLPDGLNAVFADAVSLRGFPLGVPVAVDAVVQLRNLELAPTPGTDTETQSCNGEGPCLVLPADGDGFIHYPFLAALGGYIHPTDDVTGFDTSDHGIGRPESIAGATVLEAMVTAGTVATAESAPAALEAFLAGEIPITWARAGAMASIDPASTVIESVRRIGGNPSVSAFELLTAWVSTAGEAKTEAVILVRDYFGDPEGSALIAEAAGLAPLSDADGGHAVVLDAALEGHALPGIDGLEQLMAELSTAFARIHQGVSAGEALEDAVAAITAG